MRLKGFRLLLGALFVVFAVALSGVAHSKGIHCRKSTVMKVQRELVKLGYYKGPVNGVLDEETVKAIKAFQNDHGLKVDGIPGRKTRRALKLALKEKAKKAKEGQGGAFGS